ncbi:MAG: patatin-like phospholipase family protein [Pseudomonadota bacterium]
MGITIVQKSDLRKKKPKATKALILSGGAITGGSFKAGGIKALNDYFTNFQVTDFDIFVGISSGSLLAAPLMGGISPESILRSLEGSSRNFTTLSARHFYYPNFSEWIKRPLAFLGKLALSPLDLISKGHVDVPELLSMLPSGIFDNSPIEKYLRDNIERNGLTNDFRVAQELTRKKLYICAMTLDGAKRVVFGPDEKNDVAISEAVQASTAMPGFYKPAHIQGVDYVDGGVQETANIDIAIQKGAQLIVCYNPFRPYDPDEQRSTKSSGRLAQKGVIEVLNQIFRAFFHARLHIALDHFRQDPNFKGDIILIEPSANDSDFFKLNPLVLSNRVEAARLGFRSVRNSIEAKFDEVKKIFASYGIEMTRRGVEAEFKKIMQPDVSEHELASLLERKRK